MQDLRKHVKAAQGFLDKTDGRDKLLAAIQYAAMFVAAGNPGDAKKIQVSVATARKVFRIMRPLESLSAILHNPTINPSKPVAIEIINKLKPVLMAIYFGADHIVWAQQAGISSNKSFTARAQKASLYGWFGGSLCTIVGEIYEIQALTSPQKDESPEDYAARQAAVHAEVRRRTLVLVHAIVQALLAAGLLELRPWKPRTVGLLGVAASLLNCYFLYPTVARPLWGSGRATPDVPKPAVAAPPKPAELHHAKAS